MNRRRFNAVSLASLLAPSFERVSAQESGQKQVGVQFAAINKGLLTARHSGMARAGHAVDDDMLFQVASVSKTVTSLAVLTLVRDGRIGLDDPVNRHLTRWRLPGPRGAKATIAELMSHTAGTTVHGFAGYGPDETLPYLPEILAGRRPANSGEILARHRLFGRFKYSGGGTMVLQALIEDVSRRSFADYTMAEVLRPVGAPRASFAITPKSSFAHGFFEDGRPVPGGYRRHPESAAAGLWASASGLARIYQAILKSLSGARHAILPVALAERMVTPVAQGAGLGVFVSTGPVIYHQGRNFGFDAVVAAELNTGRVRAAVTNRNGANDQYARALVPD